MSSFKTEVIFKLSGLKLQGPLYILVRLHVIGLQQQDNNLTATHPSTNPSVWGRKKSQKSD